jgi:glycosyltransferase involved in cell wall biosynthesis
MRVAYLTAGAAGMYCGSCLRDNTLAAALRAQGRDVLLVPLYTPIRTDEEDVSEHCVLYGGINVYLQQKSALFRHTPRFFDRMFDSPALLRRVVRNPESTPDDMGAMAVSLLHGRDGAQRKELARLIRWLSRRQVDLVNLPNAMFMGAAAAIRKELGVPVFCTLTGEDFFLDALPWPWRTQAIELIRRQVETVDAFVAVSRYYASHAAEQFGIAPDRVHVVPLGIRVEDYDPSAPPPPEPFTIGYLARICPEKGLHTLCEAFRLLRRSGRDCRLRIAGYLPAAGRGYLQDLLREMAGEPAGAVECMTDVDRAGKLRFLQSLHVLSVPTVYRESKGLYCLEALAAGVPVVQPDHGAFPEIITATGGGLLFEPGNPAALAEALAGLMNDPTLRQKLAQQGRAVAVKAYTDKLMAESAWRLYERYGA